MQGGCVCVSNPMKKGKYQMQSTQKTNTQLFALMKRVRERVFIFEMRLKWISVFENGLK